MALFHRGKERDEQPPAPEEDSPEVLDALLHKQVAFVNANAGRMPVDCVVAALHVTDAAQEIIEVARERKVDAHTIGLVERTLNDYLPTTLQSFLALDPAVVDQPRPSGRSPRESLVEQLDALWLATVDVLAATHANDADALLAQGAFLRTKFTRSDLDL